MLVQANNYSNWPCGTQPTNLLPYCSLGNEVGTRLHLFPLPKWRWFWYKFIWSPIAHVVMLLVQVFRCSYSPSGIDLLCPYWTRGNDVGASLPMLPLPIWQWYSCKLTSSPIAHMTMMLLLLIFAPIARVELILVQAYLCYLFQSVNDVCAS